MVKECESSLGPDDEAAEMTTRSELEKVQSLDVGEFDTREVAECFYDAVILAVDDERASALAVPTVAHLSLSGAEFARVGDLDDISVGVDALQEGNCFLGLLEGLDGGGDDERHLGDLLDAVTTGENEGGEGRSSECGDGGEATLVLVHFDVPLAPSFGRGEHATTTAHVTKCSLGGWSRARDGKTGRMYLARTVCSATADTGNPGDGATGAPGLGGGLVAGLFAHGVGLALVLCNAL